MIQGTDDRSEIYKILYGKIAEKINKFNQKKVKGDKIFQEIGNKENVFLASVPNPHGKFILYGLLCLAAIFFDFVITNKTMVSFEEFLPPAILAIILSFIDLSVATLQAGTFSKTTAGKTIARKQWRPVLWGLGLIKILLFIILVYFIYPDEFESSTNWLLTIIELLLLILVYIILDFAGEGIYFIFNKMKFTFLKKVWYEDLEPSKVDSRTKKVYSDLDLEINKNNHVKNEVYDFFNLPKS